MKYNGQRSVKVCIEFDPVMLKKLYFVNQMSSFNSVKREITPDA